jgi:flavin reductase (DIM6/NTAB) family NADH-FMN oxidoreductase RutF
VLARHLGLRFNMNMTAAPVPRGRRRISRSGDLTAAPSRLVKPPRVKESPAAFECKHWQDHRPAGRRPDDKSTYSVIFGRVVGVYIDDRFVKDGLVDTGAMRPIARLGYMDYAVVTPETVFSIERPRPRRPWPS